MLSFRALSKENKDIVKRAKKVLLNIDPVDAIGDESFYRVSEIVNMLTTETYDDGDTWSLLDSANDYIEELSDKFAINEE